MPVCSLRRAFYFFEEQNRCETRKKTLTCTMQVSVFYLCGIAL